jgi:predicted NAD/FAD-binding protein
MDHSVLGARKSAHITSEISGLSKDEITVASGNHLSATVLGKMADGTFVQLDIATSATEGNVATAILFGPADATGTAVTALAHTRLTAVLDTHLIWPESITASEKTAAIAELATQQIIVRL